MPAVGILGFCGPAGWIILGCLAVAAIIYINRDSISRALSSIPTSTGVASPYGKMTTGGTATIDSVLTPNYNPGKISEDAAGGIGIYMMSKGGRQRIRDTGLEGVKDEEIADRLKDPNTSKEEKKRLEKEQKGRDQRNKQKRKGKHKSK